MRLFNTIRNLYIIVLSTLWVSVFATTSSNVSESLEGYDHSVWNQFYTTIGWHDGGRKLGFFLPDLWHNANSHIWWDTGIVWKGSGMGYRTMLSPQHFAGVYIYYDRDESTKWNIGGELCGSDLGELTVNVYSNTWFGSQRSIMTHDIAGMSLTLSFNEWKPSVKPFLAAAYSWVNFKRDTKFTDIPSLAIGAKWIISNAVDFEVKYYIVDKEHFPIHAGFQIRWDGRNPKLNYFKHRFNRPPDRYVPGYTNYAIRSASAGGSFSSAWDFFTNFDAQMKALDDCLEQMSNVASTFENRNERSSFVNSPRGSGFAFRQSGVVGMEDISPTSPLNFPSPPQFPPSF